MGDLTEREIELIKKNDEIDRRSSTQSEWTYTSLLIQTPDSEAHCKNTSFPKKNRDLEYGERLREALQKSREENSNLTKIIETLRKELVLVKSDLKVSRLQANKPSEAATSSSLVSAEIASLKKELSEKEKALKTSKALTDSVQVRLNRQAEELAKMKAKEVETTAELKECRKNLEQMRSDMQAQVRSREKHLKQVLDAYKKQTELVHVLRQQKMHLEVSRVLDFTDGEFLNSLNWREVTDTSQDGLLEESQDQRAGINKT